MKTVTLSVANRQAVKQRALDAFPAAPRRTISASSAVLPPRGLLEAMAEAGNDASRGAPPSGTNRPP